MKLAAVQPPAAPPQGPDQQAPAHPAGTMQLSTGKPPAPGAPVPPQGQPGGPQPPAPQGHPGTPPPPGPYGAPQGGPGPQPGAPGPYAPGQAAPGAYGQQPGAPGMYPPPGGPMAPGQGGAGFPPPGGPQGFGQPPQGGAPFGQGPGGIPGAPVPPGGQRRGVPVAVILAIVLVLVLALGTGGYFLLRGSSGDGAEQKPPLSMAQMWNVDLKKSDNPPDEKLGMRSVWMTDGAVVYGDKDGVRAYDDETGKKEWELETPKGAGAVCALPAEPNRDGVGAAVFDSGGGDCSFLSVFDTKSGHTLWVRNLKGRRSEDHPLVGISNEQVVVAIGNTYSGYDISGGAGKWTLKWPAGDCTASFGMSNEYLARVSDCSKAKPHRTLLVQEHELDSFNAFVPNEKREVQRIVSDSPLVLLMSGDGPGAERALRTFDTEGKPKPDKTIELTGDLEDLDLEARTTMVDEDAKVLVTTYGNHAGMTAVDLKTGKRLWKRSGAAAVALDGENVIAVGASHGSPSHPATQDPELLSLGLRDAKTEMMGTLFTEKHDLPSGPNMSMKWDGNERVLYVEGASVSTFQPFLRAYKASSASPIPIPAD
ncbi:PQQ-binding-like beta-propeller repeat protein [Streptomyces sp. NPDC014733]|uniref:outer membrane protein assembly factor BamB family protein n=1 Tax=Streptomyces sp. NPDC014733 TaxID=3364885 RepID=UPI0036FE1934